MESSDDISSEQTEKLLQFQDLTGSDNLERCRHILEELNWDIEVAVQGHISEEEGTASAFAAPPPPEQNHVEEHHEELVEDLTDGMVLSNHQQHQPEIPATVPARNQQGMFRLQAFFWRFRPYGILQWGYFLVLFPFRFVYSSLLGLVRYVYNLLWADHRNYLSNSLSDVHCFKERFEQKYGVVHPLFCRCSYYQAISDAKKDLKFLLVYLHSSRHQDTDDFCRNTLCNSDVATFIDNHMCFWACDVNTHEGYKVSQALHECRYPFLGLIVLRHNKMSLVSRIDGNTAPHDLIARLRQCMVANEGSLVMELMSREERSFNQTLREQQDQAYLESLQADQEKERRKQEEREEQERRDNETKEQELEERRKLEMIVQRKREIVDRMPPEPDSDDPNVTKILLRLPNGTRLERRFLKNQSIKHLWNYIYVHEVAPDNFYIVKNYPKQTLACEPSATEDGVDPPTFEEVGLVKNEMLLVIDNEA